MHCLFFTKFLNAYKCPENDCLVFVNCFRPADIQVLDEKVKHIRYIPPDPELFYKPSESLIERKIIIANKEQQKPNKRQ